MKTCTRCLEIKPATAEFWYKNSHAADGLAFACKSCLRPYGAEKKQEWRERDRTRDREIYKRWRTANPGAFRAKMAHRRKRTPAWADLKAIREFYENCPVGWHVDHIIPLNGSRVSGLHVLENLQYLTAEDNLWKGNYYDPRGHQEPFRASA